MNALFATLKNIGREKFLEELIALRYLENGIILHLTNLDDDSSIYSFRSARKFINSGKIVLEQKQIKSFNKMIDEYRANVNNLKTKHRNSRIAHINSLEFPDQLEFLHFEKIIKSLVKSANKIADFIWGEEINVKFKLGSMEGILDFRSLLDGLEVKIQTE